ncbi:hypothetical protein ACT17Q_15360 [Cellulomonas sp. CW35]|uniref:hypothetical protein n=1 Tax=Cellulomonas sp. CW35 TaxID=3458249 RepID=UPI004034457D
MSVLQQDPQAVLRRVVSLRARQSVDDLEELRALRSLKAVVPQSQIAQELGISQPAVSKRMDRALKVAEVRDGFSGGSPEEIIQRFVAGLIERGQLVDELARWPYAPARATDGVDWMTGNNGEWEQVERALHRGLIDAETYTEVLDRVDTVAR